MTMTGEEVAVKLQYPGLESQVETLRVAVLYWFVVVDVVVDDDDVAVVVVFVVVRCGCRSCTPEPFPTDFLPPGGFFFVELPRWPSNFADAFVPPKSTCAFFLKTHVLVVLRDHGVPLTPPFRTLAGRCTRTCWVCGFWLVC